MLTWPHGWEINILFALRWTHLVAGTLWLGLVLFFDGVWRRFLREADRDTASRARRLLEPRLLAWYAGAGFVTVGTGFVDYVLVLSAEALAPRALVWLGAWILAAGVVHALLRLSARARALADRRLLGAALAVWLAAVAASGDWYMSRGASHKAVALSLGGGLALVMLANAWLILAPMSRRVLAALPEPEAQWERSVWLASRMNLWLSLAVLFFMAAASHLPFFRTLER
jgi:uncharacterized membrane protein